MAEELFVDLTNKRLVASSKGGAEKPLTSPFHQDKISLKIQPLDYSSSGSQSGQPYQVLDASAYSISILVTDTAATPATLSGPATTWTPDGTALSGTVDLHTAAMDTAFTSVSELNTYFWIQISDGSSRRVTIKASVTIYKSAITSATTTEYPAEEVVLRSELSQYVRFANNPDGATITLRSPSGTSELILGANDDDSAAANLG